MKMVSRYCIMILYYLTKFSFMTRVTILMMSKNRRMMDRYVKDLMDNAYIREFTTVNHYAGKDHNVRYFRITASGFNYLIDHIDALDEFKQWICDIDYHNTHVIKERNGKIKYGIIIIQDKRLK